MERRVIALFADSQREWAALLVDGQLQDIYSCDYNEYSGPWRGDVCVAAVTRVVAGGRAAFLDLGEGRAGFLGDATGLDPGDQILVQVDRFAFEEKAARVRENIWLAGESSVIHRNGDGVSVSKRIRNVEVQHRLSNLLDPLAHDVRVVVRASAQSIPSEELYQEVLSLCGRLERLESEARRGGPRTLVKAPSPVQHGMRAWMGGYRCDIIVAGDQVREAVGNKTRISVTMFEDERDLLHQDDLDQQIRLLLGERVNLYGGGWISIEKTKALVAIDVNTGNSGFKGTPPVEISYRAALAIPRQLRLRGLGGIVVIDFPRGSERDTDRIDETIKRTLASESVPSGRAYGWTEAGLYEISRFRDRRPLVECFGD